jgi:hypothetical protein
MSTRPDTPLELTSGALPTRARWIFGVPLVILLLALMWIAFPFVRPYIQERMGRIRFNSVGWQTASRTNAVRIRMVDDLLLRHRFRGMTRQQVTGIVGEPDKTEYFSDWDMVYWLGGERGFISIDSEWLVFRLDGQQKVTDHRIVRD